MALYRMPLFETCIQLYPSKHVIHPILCQCWPNVLDAGPPLKHHLLIIPCFARSCFETKTTIKV